MNKQKILLISVLSLSFLIIAGSAVAALTFSSTAITSTGSLTYQGVGSVGDYTPANNGIFIKDGAGTEILRIYASDPDTDNDYNSGNLYIGNQAGLNQPTDNASAGFYNTGLGFKALYSNTLGNRNTANGYLALYSNTEGVGNTANGTQSLRVSTIGSYNTAYGYGSQYSNITGENNVAIGYSSLYSNSTGSNNVAIGFNAGAYETGSNAFYIDNQNRANTAGDKAGALLYGTFNATPSLQTLTINGKMILPYSATPATSSTACTTGTIAWDASYTYVCVATNTWKRSALTTW